MSWRMAAISALISSSAEVGSCCEALSPSTEFDQALQAGVHGRHRCHRRLAVEQVVDARGDLVEAADDIGRAALGKRRHDVAAQRIEPVLEALDRVLRCDRRVAAGDRHLQLFAELGELAFQPLDGAVGGAVVALDEARLEIGAERIHAPLEPFDGRGDRGVVAAGERRLDTAADLGDAHFETLDRARAVVGFERPAQRQDLFTESIEVLAIGGVAGNFLEPRRDRLGARLDLLQRWLGGAVLHHAAQRFQVLADGGEQRTVERPLGRQRLDAARQVEGRALVLRPGAVEAGHLFGERGEIGAQRRHGGRKRLLVAAHGQRLGAVVEHALVGRDFGDRRGKVFAAAPGLGLLRCAARRLAPRLQPRFAPGLGPDFRFALAVGEPAADVAQPLLDARDLFAFAGRGRCGRGAVSRAAGAGRGSRGWMSRALASSIRASSPRSAASMVAARSPRALRPGLRPFGKQGVEPRADVVHAAGRLLALRRGALAHPGDAPVEIVNGLCHPGDVGGRRRPGAALSLDHGAGTFVGILDVAGELLDHCGNPLQRTVRPSAFGLTGQPLLDLVEAPDEVRNRCARPFVHGAQAGGETVEGGGDRRRIVAVRFARAAGRLFADGVVQPLVDRDCRPVAPPCRWPRAFPRRSP